MKRIIVTLMVVCSIIAVTIFGCLSAFAFSPEDTPVPGHSQTPPPLPRELRDFVDPVTIEVQKMKAQDMSDEEILKVLRDKGMGWYPETGATWMGVQPTPEELSQLPPRNYPFDDVTSESGSPAGATRTVEISQVMQTTGNGFTGVNNSLIPGSLAIQGGQTEWHLATTHVGFGGDWTEIGVIRGASAPDWRIFSYDPDENGYIFHGTTSYTTQTGYIIYVYPNNNPPYTYNIWVNGNWVRQGHLNNYNNRVDESNEAWSDTANWTNDTAVAYHKDPFLYVGDSSAIWWDRWVPSQLVGTPPMRYLVFFQGCAWQYYSYVYD